LLVLFSEFISIENNGLILSDLEKLLGMRAIVQKVSICADDIIGHCVESPGSAKPHRAAVETANQVANM